MREERRSNQRARFSGVAVVRTAQAEITCQGRDISERGMRIRHLRRPSIPSEPLTLLFAPPTKLDWVAVEASLVWTSSAGALEWGLEFVDLPDEIRRYIRAYVAETSQERSDAPALPPLELPTVPAPQETAEGDPIDREWKRILAQSSPTASQRVTPDVLEPVNASERNTEFEEELCTRQLAPAEVEKLLAPPEQTRQVFRGSIAGRGPSS
jgi:hypothetical protein